MKKQKRSLWDNLTTFYQLFFATTGELSYHFLHQTDQFHESSPQLCHFFIYFGDVLLVDFCQWFKSMSPMLLKEKKREEEEEVVVNNTASLFHFIPLLLNFSKRREESLRVHHSFWKGSKADCM